MKSARRLLTCIGESVSLADLLVYALLVLLAGMQFVFYIRSRDAAYDATYVDLTRSILEKHSYELNFQPETLYPPGFPAILAAVCLVAGYSQAVLFHVIAVAAFIGLLASYELLRRAEGRAFAAAACLVLGSTPAFFAFDTALVLSDTAYFAASMLALLLAFKLERATGAGRRRLAVLFGIALLATPLIRSSGVALLAGLCAWLAVAFIGNRSSAWRRVRAFIIPLLVAGAAQAMWSGWASHRQSKEWNLPGWPQSYFSQLKVKNGNDPELGEARLRDIPVRIEENIEARSIALVRLVTEKTWIAPNWSSPAVFGVVALVAIGLLISILKGGGELQDWYFLFHEAMFLLWPWDLEIRFLLPIVPLALLYAVRGAKAIAVFSRRQPRKCGFLFISAAAPLGAASLAWTAETRNLQPLFSLEFWGILMTAGIVLVSSMPERPARLLVIPWSWIAVRARRLAELSAFCAVALIIAAGISGQLRAAHQNLTFRMPAGPYYADIEAARWIERNEPARYVVMARKEDLAIHYSEHKVVWFPPISDPVTLMNGIRQFHVRLVVVVDRDSSYWQPPELVCFRNLLGAYRQYFRLIHTGNRNWVYEVMPQARSGT